MRNWFLPPSLFSPEADAGAGSGTLAVDPGVPYEHGHEPREEKKPAEKSDTDKRLDALERENADLKRRYTDAEEDAKFWRRRAATPAKDESDDEPTPQDPIEEPITEKPEKLLDDLGAEGLAALQKRGLITQGQLAHVLQEQERKTEARITAAREDAEFAGKFNTEFPEIAEDSARVERGESPKSDLYKRTGEIYRQMVAEDPSVKGSKFVLITAARQAKAELGRSKETRTETRTEDESRGEDRQARRRQRIDQQRPERSTHAEEGSANPSFSSEQLTVMKNLGVSQEAFQRHAKGR